MAASVSRYTPLKPAGACYVSDLVSRANPSPRSMISRVPTAAELDALAAITEDKLRRVVQGRGPREGLGGIADALERHRRKAAINTPLRSAHFIAQLAHESGRFRTLVESFAYTPARAKAVFPRLFKTEEEAAELLAKDTTGEAFANLIYGGKNGNRDPGDGYRYRGRGFIQLTGRNNYAAAGKDLGLDLVGDPDSVATVDIAAQTSVSYWKRTGINAVADLDSVDAVAGLINRAKEGLEDRKQLLQAAKTAFFPRP